MLHSINFSINTQIRYAQQFIMAERQFLSQYTAVSREKRLRILIEQSFYSLLLSVFDI